LKLLVLVASLAGGFHAARQHQAGQPETPNVNFSDGNGVLPIESLAFAAPNLRPKRDDSINIIIRRNWQ